MKKILSLLVAMMAVVAIASCSHNDNYDDMPQKIQNFISQYYPNSAVSNFSSTSDSYTVIIKSGPTITFDANYNWTSINGNGMPLPKVLLFNDFPPVLYNYLQETENTDNVFSVIRNSKTYVVELLDYTLTYDIAQAEITGKQEKP